jgi:hypothetical protein
MRALSGGHGPAPCRCLRDGSAVCAARCGLAGGPGRLAAGWACGGAGGASTGRAGFIGAASTGEGTTLRGIRKHLLWLPGQATAAGPDPVARQAADIRQGWNASISAFSAAAA